MAARAAASRSRTDRVRVRSTAGGRTCRSRGPAAASPRSSAPGITSVGRDRWSNRRAAGRRPGARCAIAAARTSATADRRRSAGGSLGRWRPVRLVARGGDQGNRAVLAGRLSVAFAPAGDQGSGTGAQRCRRRRAGRPSAILSAELQLQPPVADRRRDRGRSRERRSCSSAAKAACRRDDGRGRPPPRRGWRARIPASRRVLLLSTDPAHSLGDVSSAPRWATPRESRFRCGRGRTRSSARAGRRRGAGGPPGPARGRAGRDRLGRAVGSPKGPARRSAPPELMNLAPPGIDPGFVRRPLRGRTPAPPDDVIVSRHRADRSLRTAAAGDAPTAARGAGSQVPLLRVLLKCPVAGAARSAGRGAGRGVPKSDPRADRAAARRRD